jgi:Ca2+-transporting ATPase
MYTGAMSSSSKDPILKIVHARDVQEKTYAYHAHDYREVITVVDSAEDGLTLGQVRVRQQKDGSNSFTQKKEDTLFKRVLVQLSSPIAFVLVVAFLLTFVLGEYLDSGVIALALMVAVFVGVLQEGKASQAFEKLSKSQVAVATVIREGKKQEINASELVVGDMIVMQAGTQIPADVRLVRVKQLSINEASLTGEWMTVKKSARAVAVGTPFADQSSMAWMGTFVAEGYATGVVIAVGDQTAVGQLAKNVRDIKEVDTPLQVEMKRLSKIMLYIVGVLVVLIFLVGIIQNHPLQELLLMSIAIAVASIPEGLPAAVTIVLALGMDALLKRGGLVRNLLAAETLGSTTYVLTDKTGTLTQAIMSVTGVLVEEGELVDAKDFGDFEQVRELFDVSLTAADAYTEEKSTGNVVHGDSVEIAVLKAGAHIGVLESKGSLRAERIDYLAFTSENRFAAGLAEEEEGLFRLCVNGAPEFILAKAQSIVRSDGREEVLHDEARLNISQAIASCTEQGKRLIAVGYKKVGYDDIPETEPSLLDDLVLAGILIIDDPIRSGVSNAITGVQSAGARVVLITGDNPQTALSIAQEVGIAQKDDVALTGNDIVSLSDEELLIALQEVSVFARVLPNQKMRIATVLQKKGEVVAMTGDGINDAPALRRANIGIAIGSGTEVAKEASDLVLVNDSFETIYSAIEEGRRITSNLRKIVAYLLSTSLTEVALFATALLTSSAVPILPAQILWANMMEEGLMSVAFAFEKSDKNSMKRKPHDIHEEGLISKQMLWFMAFVITILSMFTVALYLYVKQLGLPINEVRSVMFLAISADSLFLSFAFRSLTVPIWKIPLRTNLFFLGSFLLSASMLAVVMTVPFFQFLLSYTPVPFELISLVLIASTASLAIIEIGKYLFFENRD